MYSRCAKGIGPMYRDLFFLKKVRGGEESGVCWDKLRMWSLCLIGAAIPKQVSTPIR